MIDPDDRETQEHGQADRDAIETIPGALEASAYSESERAADDKGISGEQLLAAEKDDEDDD